MTQIPWNKGLTKETDPRVAAYGINGTIARTGKSYHTGESKKKISKAMIGNKNCEGFKHTRETKKKMSEVHQRKKMNGEKYSSGWKLSEEIRKKMSQRQMGIASPFTGWKHTEETKKKISEAHKGGKNYSWIDGRSMRPGYKGFGVKNYRIRKKGNGGTHAFSEWETLKKLYDFTCPSCQRSEPEIRLTEDHIIPISLGGSDNIDNIQPLCRPCNCSKQNKIIKY